MQLSGHPAVRCLKSAMIAMAATDGVHAQADDWMPGQAPIATRWAADVAPHEMDRVYPRPQLVRDEWVSLNGLWEFAPAEEGDEAPPFRKTLERRIRVPFPIESALSGIMEHHDRIWYRRAFTIPQEWSGRQILLHFGAVDWETRVWVNGAEVGEHRGGYDPFSFDITPLLRDGEQELVVGVFDPTDEGTQPRGKQVRNPEGIWYTPTTGIWQSVWLEPVSLNHIDDVEIDAHPDTGIAIRPRLWTPGPGQYTVELHVRDGEQEINRAGVSFEVGPGEVRSVAGVTLAADGLDLWAPDHPKLYNLDVVLSAGGEEIDRVRSYFGVRSIELGKNAKGVTQLFLNGEPCFMVGTLDQGFWPDGLYTAPTDEALKYDIEMTKAMGFNTIRKHVKVEPARWYYWCDVLGVLVWQDMPSGDAYIGGADPDLVRSEESAKQFERELRAMIHSLRNHPSIVMWVPFNEGWGQYDTPRITDLIREVDPTRLVNSASGWTDRGTGDVHDVHSYPGPGAPSVEGNRAGVLGEFGGLGLAIAGHTWSETSWGYRGMKDAEELAHRYEQLLRGVHELKETSGLAAAIYTQITDVETETNGLMTYDRAVVKVDPARIAAANRGEFPVLHTLIPCAKDEPTIEWRFTLDEPLAEWSADDFDDSLWKTGLGGFGAAGTPGAIIGTEWMTSDIWIRRSFNLAEAPEGDVRLLIHHDEDAKVYINGVLAAELSGYTTGYEDVMITGAARASLRQGGNTIAIHCRQTRGGQYIDAGLVAVAPAVQSR